MFKSKWCRLILIALITAFSLVGCSLSNIEDDDERPSKNTSSQKNSTIFSRKESNDDGDYQNLVINDYTVQNKQRIIETKGSFTYILLDSEIIEYPFKLPYATDCYPDLSTENGQITLTWMDQNEVILRIDMVEGSNEAYINNSNEPIDMGVAPKTVEGKLFIPVNLLISALKLEETYDRSLKYTFFHYEEDFPKDILLGNWSDSDTDLFTTFVDSSGLKSISSSVVSYQFNKDGTYQHIIAVVGGFVDGFAYQKGKYKILGNTIIYYDHYETYYKGNPFKLVSKDKKMEHPSFEFIDDYNPNENKIHINNSWVNRIDP